MCAEERWDHFDHQWKKSVSSYETSHGMKSLYRLLESEYLGSKGSLFYATHGPNIRPSYK